MDLVFRMFSGSLEVLVRVRAELLQAAWIAKVVRVTLVVELPRRLLRQDTHATNGINDAFRQRLGLEDRQR
jgi:hypothetical protein